MKHIVLYCYYYLISSTSPSQWTKLIVIFVKKFGKRKGTKIRRMTLHSRIEMKLYYKDLSNIFNIRSSAPLCTTYDDGNG